MKSLLAALSAMLVSATFVSIQTTNSKTGTTVLQSVVHINFAEPERQEGALGNIENILKAVPKAEIEVVCHGKGINLVLKKDSNARR
jgi:hypothetical protein